MFLVLEIAVAGSLAVLHFVISGVTRRVIDTRIQVVEVPRRLLSQHVLPATSSGQVAAAGCLNARAQHWAAGSTRFTIHYEAALANICGIAVTGAPCFLKPPDSSFGFSSSPDEVPVPTGWAPCVWPRPMWAVLAA